MTAASSTEAGANGFPAVVVDPFTGHLWTCYANACIEWEQRDGKPFPKVYIIDFDEAWISKAPLSGVHVEINSD